MRTEWKREAGILSVAPAGRLDTVGARALEAALESALDEETSCAVFDMSGVEYLSSAGLRVLMKVQKALRARGGALAVSGLNDYCGHVVNVAGLSGQLRVFKEAGRAMAFARQLALEQDAERRWDELPVREMGVGRFRIAEASPEAASVHVLGHVNDVLWAAVTPEQLSSKRFAEREYSIGLGGLGDAAGDTFHIMGEMITVGGTMVWLPTDGNDTPDFLIPRADDNAVMIRTAYNVSLAGAFNWVIAFESADPEGARVDAIYEALFALAREREDFKGVLGVAMAGEMSAVYGSGVRHSPVKDLAPANGGRIIDPENVAEWMELDKSPRHRDVTGLVVGIGADPSANLDAYDREFFDAVFYRNPGNPNPKAPMLHNHCVLFERLALPERTLRLEQALDRVVEEGEFVDMRHLLDASTVTRALIGVMRVQSFERDPAGG